MSFTLQVNGNEEGKKRVTLISKMSRGQYRRWRRYRNIKSKREKGLNPRGDEMKLSEESLSSNSFRIESLSDNTLRDNQVRATQIRKLVEVFGFGGRGLSSSSPHGNLKSIDRLGRALGAAGFHVTIVPLPSQDFVEVNAKSAGGGHAQILLTFSQKRKIVVIRDIFRGQDAHDKEKVLKGLTILLNSLPHDTYFVPHYAGLQPEDYDFLRKFQERTPRKWASPVAAEAVILGLAQEAQMGGAKERRRVGYESQFSNSRSSSSHSNLSGKKVFYTDPETGDEIELDPTTGGRGMGSGGGAHHSSSESERQQHGGGERDRAYYYYDDNNNNDRHGHEHEKVRIPRPGFGSSGQGGQEGGSPDIFGHNVGYDLWGTWGMSGSPHHFRDPRVRQHGGIGSPNDPSSSSNPTSFVQPYVSSVGREGEEQSISGRGTPQFARNAAARAREEETGGGVGAAGQMEKPYIEPEPGRVHPSVVATPNPDDKISRRIPDSEKAHRHLRDQLWGPNHPAVQKVKNVLEHMGPVIIRDEGKKGIYLTTHDGLNQVRLDLAGWSGGFRKGVVEYRTANLHDFSRFLDLLPHMALLRETKPSQKFPLDWTNDYTKLIRYVGETAPELLVDLANVLNRDIPKNSKRTGMINRLIKTAQGIPKSPRDRLGGLKRGRR